MNRLLMVLERIHALNADIEMLRRKEQKEYAQSFADSSFGGRANVVSE